MTCDLFFIYLCVCVCVCVCVCKCVCVCVCACGLFVYCCFVVVFHDCHGLEARDPTRDPKT